MLNSDFKIIFEEATPKDLKVGQIWKCLENQNVVLIKRVGETAMQGYMFNGFEVGDFFSFCQKDFVKYYKCIYNPNRTCHG